jgi:hypothetical protein
VKSKAKHALPYNPTYVKEIFENKNDQGTDVFIPKRTKSVIFNKYPNNNRVKSVKKQDDNSLLALEYNSEQHLQVQDAPVKFKPKSYFNCGG